MVLLRPSSTRKVTIFPYWTVFRSVQCKIDCLRGRSWLSAVGFEAPGGVARLEDIAVVGDAVEQRRGHFGVAEHGRPFAEGEVRGDDDAGPLIKLADEVEQQLPSRAGERQITELVEIGRAHV